MEGKQYIRLIMKVWIVVSIAIGAMLLFSVTEPIKLAKLEKEYVNLNHGWEQIVGDTRISIEAPEDLQYVPVGEWMVFERTIPEINRDKILLVYAENQELDVFIEDASIYEFKIQEELAFIKTPGYTWNQIIIPAEQSGKTMRIEFRSQFERYQMGLYDIYWVDSYSEVVWIQIKEYWVLASAALLIILLAIVTYTNTMIWKETNLWKYLISMADLYLIVGLWLLAEISFFDWIFHRPTLTYLLDMILLRILPIAFYRFVVVNLPYQYKKLVLLEIAIWFNLIASCILQFCFGVSFVDTLVFNNIIFILGAVIGCIVLGHCIWKLRKETNKNYQFSYLGILIAGGLIDVYFYYAYSTATTMIGLATAFTFTLYAMIAHVFLVKEEASTKVERDNLELGFNKLKNTTLMQQIKAHFLFNTLNTISALCKQDAKKADDAIKLFARFMRDYMYLINQQEVIDFTDELDFVTSYLQIEKLRFGASFDFELDIQYTDFDIPPLTIQPLVENAVMHGVRQVERHGTVVVSSRKIGDFAYVTVFDNGVGFDVNSVKEGKSIGLTNLIKRVKLMSFGTVTIQSIIGKGTEITIVLPNDMSEPSSDDTDYYSDSRRHECRD